jgi:hypothetical protein
MARIREQLTYSNVMVTVLAFVVLGGTAWALAKNTVGTKQLKTSAVHTKDIDDGAVTAEKVADGVVPAPPTVSVRTTTQTIPMSCSESSFTPGTFFLSCSGQATITAPCSAGEHAEGGGYKTPPPVTSGPTVGASILDSRPEPTSGTPNSWVLRASAFGSNTASTSPVPRPPDPEVTAYAVCST